MGKCYECKYCYTNNTIQGLEISQAYVAKMNVMIVSDMEDPERRSDND